MKKIFIIAGEASGDLHGANLIHNLRALSPSLEIYGVGGDKIKETGAKEFFDLAHFHVTGITQALLALPKYLAAKKIILESIRRAKPSLVVLIDNPGFNLHLAASLKAMEIPVVYYITPQVWAWKKNRIFKIKKFVKKALVVFDFERAFFEKHGIDAVFVGHPLKDLIGEIPEKTEPSNTISLMPGSRRHEVSTLLPVFIQAASLLAKKRPELEFKLIEAPTLPTAFYEAYLKNVETKIGRVSEKSYEAIEKSALVLACSGTATLECALLKTPMVISNKAGLLTYAVAKCVVKIPYLGLPNIILDRAAFPELLQYDATPEKIAAAAESLLEYSGQEKSREDLNEISRRLGHPGASRRAAEEILKTL